MTFGAKSRGSGAHSIILAVLGSFFISGLATGFLFALLITRPDLNSFFFIKAPKFLIPRYSYWFAFSLLQVFGLAAAYVVCVLCRWLNRNVPMHRALGAVAIIALATPFLRLITPAMNMVMGLNWDIVIAPAMYLILISLALCILSDSLRLLGLAIIWVFGFTAVGFVLAYVAVRLSSSANQWYEFVQWPVVESMLGLSFGSWLIWRRR